MPAGNLADLAYAIQTSKGTPATASSHRFYLTGGGLAPRPSTARLEETSGSRLRTGSYMQQIRAEGSPAAYVRPNMIGGLLYSAMGAKAVSGASDPYTHTFTLASTQPWLTFWRMLGAGLFERFTDCKLSSLSIRSSAGQPLIVTAGIVGLGPANKTAAETTVPVEKTNTFMHYDGKGALKVETVPVTRIESFSLTINTGADTQQGDDVTPFDAPEGMLEIMIETTETITDFALYKRMIYGSSSPADNATPTKDVLTLGGVPAGLDFLFTRVAAAPGPERSLGFTATNVQIEDITGLEVNTDGQPIKQTVRYGIYEPASGSGLTAVLKNGVTSYPAL